MTRAIFSKDGDFGVLATDFFDEVGHISSYNYFDDTLSEITTLDRNRIIEEFNSILGDAKEKEWCLIYLGEPLYG